MWQDIDFQRKSMLGKADAEFRRDQMPAITEESLSLCKDDCVELEYTSSQYSYQRWPNREGKRHDWKGNGAR